MVTELLLAPPIAFGIFFLISLIIDRVGVRASAAQASTGDAFGRAWASGEDHPRGESRPSYRLYHIGIGFTVVHVAVLLIATIPTDVSGVLLGLPLLIVVGLSLFAVLDTERPQPGR